ncbi:MAG: hypothetical protein GX558_03565 [Clostridiales bacterium]|nr:hypothetical protein [Clostridiales bacterium]
MVRYGAWQVGFYNPGMRPDRPDLFGCATMGAVTGRQYHLPANTGLFMWGDRLRGCVYAGAYDEVLAGVRKCAFRPSLMIALFAAAEGADDFLQALQSAMPGVTVTGGVAAAAEGLDRGEISPAGGDVALFMSETGSFTASRRNVLEARGGIYEFDVEPPRLLKRLRQPDMPWEMAGAVLADLKERYRVPPDDFSSITFSDNDGVNLYLHPEGEWLRAASNLPDKGYLHLRTTPAAVAGGAIVEYAQMPNALIIGCAAFRGMISRPFSVPEGSTMVFLDSEVADGRLGNLMLVSVRR